MNQLPLDASPRQILNARDEQLKDLLARRDILAIRNRALAEQKASAPDPNNMAEQANSRLMDARAAVSKKEGCDWTNAFPKKYSVRITNR